MGRELGRELARERSHVRLRLPGEALDLVEGAIESFGLDRLEQVVEGIDAKRLDGIAVGRGREDDRHVAVETLEQLEARQAGHLDVQEQHVDRVRLKEGERRDGIGFRAHDVDAAGRHEQPRQPLDGEPFIVDEVCAHVVTVRLKRL